jgi:hypothetical protein
VSLGRRRKMVYKAPFSQQLHDVTTLDYMTPVCGTSLFGREGLDVSSGLVG